MANTTYVCGSGSQSDSDLLPAGATFSKIAAVGGASSGTMSHSVVAGSTNFISYSWSTGAGIPGSPKWPVSSTYSGSINITTLGADVTARLILYHVDSAGNILETLVTGANYTATGVQTVSGVASPASGSTTDRYQMRITSDNAGSMGENNGVTGSTTSCLMVFPDPIGTINQGLMKNNNLRPKIFAPGIAR